MTKNSRNNDLLTNDETSKSPSKNCSVNQSRQFACDLCSHTYNNETALMRHQGFHDKTRKYSCEKCSFRFIANSHLKRHRQKYCSYRGVSSTPTEADPQSSTPTKAQSYLKHPPPEPEEPKQQSYILSRLFSGGHMNDDKAKNVIWKNKVKYCLTHNYFIILVCSTYKDQLSNSLILSLYCIRTMASLCSVKKSLQERNQKLLSVSKYLVPSLRNDQKTF